MPPASAEDGSGRAATRARMTSVPPAPAVASARPGFFGWWHDGTPDAKRALVAAGLGWMLDAFDVMLYALLLTAIIADLGMTRRQPGASGR